MLEDALSAREKTCDLIMACLNPYYAGRCSFRRFRISQGAKAERVLILIMLEDALSEGGVTPKMTVASSLNPYYAGRCSFRYNENYEKEKVEDVLILIMLEDALSGTRSLQLSMGSSLS